MKHIYHYLYPGKIYPDKLNIILGLARSGTTWTANTLAKTSTPIRYFEEPLFHFQPKLILDKGFDHTGIAFTKTSKENEKLEWAYSLFTKKIISYIPFLKKEFFRRKDYKYEKVLVKEVHALMGGQHLLKAFPAAKFIFLRKDILTILDSLIYAQEYDTIYHISESQNLTSSVFLSSFFPKCEAALKEIIHGVSNLKNEKSRLLSILTISFFLTQKYYENLVREHDNLKIFDYESIVVDPDFFFSQISEWFGLNYKDKQHQNFVYKAEEAHYNINRSRTEVLNRKLKILTDIEVKIINDILHQLKIITKSK